MDDDDGFGIGVGVGLGLASAPWASASARAGLTVDRVEQELRRLLVDAAATKVTFDEFPYYLRFARSLVSLVRMRSVLHQTRI